MFIEIFDFTDSFGMKAIISPQRNPVEWQRLKAFDISTVS